MADIYPANTAFKMPPLMGGQPEAVGPEDLAVLRRYDSADVADIVGPLYVMDSALRPLHGAVEKTVGYAITVKTPVGDNKAVLGALSFCGRDTVLVVDARGHVGSCGSGSKVLATPAEDGFAGVICDGAWRDAAEVAALGVGLYARSTAIASPAKAAMGEINIPVHCAGVVVRPGDVLLADCEGIVVIPRPFLRDVLATLQAKTASADDSPSAVRQRHNQRKAQYMADFEKAGGQRRG